MSNGLGTKSLPEVQHVKHKLMIFVLRRQRQKCRQFKALEDQGKLGLLRTYLKNQDLPTWIPSAYQGGAEESV